MLAREARGTAVFTRGVEFGRNPDTPRRKPDKGGEAERRGLRDRQQDCGRGREKERKETKREKRIREERDSKQEWGLASRSCRAFRSQAHSTVEGRDGWPQKSLPAKPHQPSEAQTRTEQSI